MKQIWFLFCLQFTAAVWATADMAKPLMKDFMGICVHTVQFKPDLYKPICRLVRDYHGLEWDLGDETDFWPTFPLARNRVDWGSLYGQWVKDGYEIDASILLGATSFEKWKHPARDAETYGFALARFFGPQGRQLLTSIEIGNEPGHYTDEQYRVIFEHMARGIRTADPAIKIVTCAAVAGLSHKYAKSLSCFKGLEDCYDVLNVHSYAEVQGWPTWERSYPEDTSIDFLKNIRDVIDWRNENAPGKPVWLTEFGWDACSKPAAKEGTFKDWKSSTETEQAAYLVRAWLLFSSMDLQRAYMFWFNDDDKPQVHGASGLTRNYRPKPAFWAAAHLYDTLGNYRFFRPVLQSPQACVFEYVPGTDANGSKKILVAWLAGKPEKTSAVTFPIGSYAVERAERMPLNEDKPSSIAFQTAGGHITLECSGVPVYLHLRN